MYIKFDIAIGECIYIPYRYRCTYYNCFLCKIIICIQYTYSCVKIYIRYCRYIIFEDIGIIIAVQIHQFAPTIIKVEELINEVNKMYRYILMLRMHLKMSASHNLCNDFKNIVKINQVIQLQVFQSILQLYSWLIDLPFIIFEQSKINIMYNIIVSSRKCRIRTQE